MATTTCKRDTLHVWKYKIVRINRVLQRSKSWSLRCNTFLILASWVKELVLSSPALPFTTSRQDFTLSLRHWRSSHLRGITHQLSVISIPFSSHWWERRERLASRWWSSGLSCWYGCLALSSPHCSSGKRWEKSCQFTRSKTFSTWLWSSRCRYWRLATSLRALIMDSWQKSWKKTSQKTTLSFQSYTTGWL